LNFDPTIGSDIQAEFEGALYAARITSVGDKKPKISAADQRGKSRHEMNKEKVVRGFFHT